MLKTIKNNYAKLIATTAVASAGIIIASSASAGVIIHGHGDRHGGIAGFGPNGAGFIHHNHGHVQAGGIGRNGGIFGLEADKGGHAQSYHRLPNGETVQRTGHYNKNGHYVVNSNICDANGKCHSEKWKSQHAWKK